MTQPNFILKTLKSLSRPLIFGLVALFALSFTDAAFAKKHKHKKHKHKHSYSKHHHHHYDRGHGRHHRHHRHHRHNRHYYDGPYYTPYYSPYRVPSRRGVSIHF